MFLKCFLSPHIHSWPIVWPLSAMNHAMIWKNDIWKIVVFKAYIVKNLNKEILKKKFALDLPFYVRRREGVKFWYPSIFSLFCILTKNNLSNERSKLLKIRFIVLNQSWKNKVTTIIISIQSAPVNLLKVVKKRNFRCILKELLEKSYFQLLTVK